MSGRNPVAAMLGLFGVDDKPFGILAEYETVPALLTALERVRDEGFACFDAYTPIPVHGIDEAMDIKMSKIPWLAFFGGVAGVAGGLLMQWWMNAVDYAYISSNKPFFAYPQAFPITFETMVLLSAVSAVGGLFALCGWPQWYNPLFRVPRFRRATIDRYFICIETRDPKFNRKKIETLFQETGASAIEEVAG
jgi:hypothetical protein